MNTSVQDTQYEYFNSVNNRYEPCWIVQRYSDMKPVKSGGDCIACVDALGQTFQVPSVRRSSNPMTVEQLESELEQIGWNLEINKRLRTTDFRISTNAKNVQLKSGLESTIQLCEVVAILEKNYGVELP